MSALPRHAWDRTNLSERTDELRRDALARYDPASVAAVAGAPAPSEPPQPAEPPDESDARMSALSRVSALAEAVLGVYAARPCFVCGSRGACRHREIDCALAEIEAAERRAARR